MSRFITKIPVDVLAVQSLLPSKSFIHGATFDKDAQAIFLEWENDRFHTPFTVATEFPVETLSAKKVPAGVTVKGYAPAPTEPPVKRGLFNRKQKTVDAKA